MPGMVAQTGSTDLCVAHQNVSAQELERSTGLTLAKIDDYTSELTVGNHRDMIRQKTAL